ncbi:MAG: GAF domain-containing protein, partial [Candidatus Heimdallarchaeota archaeon]|nr:GAF domain-containing protein [Candidatus Heimdallarchaeota archaeon]MCK5145000.1 GAF domain-containing protein [Candidatus Heimdallarchaeota archaeon]
VIGVLNAEKFTLDGFTNDDVALLHALAKVTSTYVVQKRLEELTNTLFNFAEKLVDINNLVDVFKEIINSIKSTQDYEYLTISIVDHELETVNLVAYYGFTGSLNHIKTLDLMLTKSVVVRAARERRIIRINNTTKDKAFVPIESDAMKSEIAVPFFSEEGIIIGIINIESKYLNSFNKDDQIILEKFGRILAKAFRKFSANDIRLMKFE